MQPVAAVHDTPLVLTSGEPAGIGPDICLQLAAGGALAGVTVLGDAGLFRARAQQLGLGVDIVTGRYAPPAAGALHLMPVPLRRPCVAGQLDPSNSAYVLQMLDIAVSGCRDKTFAGMVTAPVHKGVINDAGVSFTGHTEYLADRSDTPHVVMMLVAGDLRVALATTHLPLRRVPDAITRDALRETLSILLHDLRVRFGIGKPRVLVLGLNPHAGESGHLGREELDVIAPVIEEFTSSGEAVRGPLPADTAFTPRQLAGSDAVLAMYHDQGLPVLKYAGFGEAVNVTLGLPFIRTSVDHGTALELAGSGKADAGSLRAAIDLARRLATR